MISLKDRIRKNVLDRRTLIIGFIVIIVSLLYIFFFRHMVAGPASEQRAHGKLEQTKQHSELSQFETDGCSGNVSNGWNTAITELSKLSPEFAQKYQDTQHIPFESACVTHDLAYHQGTGGYTARLEADNRLKDAIISYSLSHTDEIKNRTGLTSDGEAILLYKSIAEIIYRAVRLGGAPCTTKPYAWGFGYNNGTCS